MTDAYRGLAYRLVGPHVGRAPGTLAWLSRLLPRAGDPVRPDMHLATIAFTAALGLAAGFVLMLPFAVVSDAALPARILAFLFVPIILASCAALPLLLGPIARAQARRKSIDAHLAGALHYVATMASAGTAPERIFAGLARQTVYGEVAVEAAFIVRDMRMLGRDLRSAFRAAGARTPSERMEALLQGAVTALDSGDDLAAYFLMKSRQFERDDHENEKKFIESLGVLAETYVTLVVAAPVFLLVLLSVLIVLGSGPIDILGLGYFLVLVFVPLVQLLFGMVLNTMTPGADA